MKQCNIHYIGGDLYEVIMTSLQGAIKWSHKGLGIF